MKDTVANTVPVAYVAGFGRSGSTVMEGILHTRYAATGLGETFFLWERGVLRNELCGCGVQFRTCPFWTEVLRDAFGRVTQYDATVYDREFKRTHARWPQFGSMRRAGPPSELFRSLTEALYTSIHRHADGEVLIDSSKYPLYGAWLSKTPSIDLSVLHLFRDPRGVTYSWSQLKERPESVGDQDYMAVSKSPLTSIWRWKWINRWSDELRKSYGLPNAILSYEQFCDAPEFHLDLIAKLLDLKPRRTPSTGWHSVSGNPLRFENKDLSIRKDERWRTELKPSVQKMTMLLCADQYRHLCQEAAEFLNENGFSPERSRPRMEGSYGV